VATILVMLNAHSKCDRMRYDTIRSSVSERARSLLVVPWKHSSKKSASTTIWPGDREMTAAVEKKEV
jgi:hypothetical protein